MSKKVYISPLLEEIHVESDLHLLAGSDGGHTKGNPRQTGDDDDDEEAKFNRAGSWNLWSDEESRSASHGRTGLWH